MERRTFKLTEVRATGGEGGREFVGYAAVFNQLSEDLGGFRERIRPGAFAATLEEDDIRAVWNHNSDLVLGRVKAGTLELEEDARGLKVTIRPPDAQWARDHSQSIERGDVDQMSFAFQTVRDEWEYLPGAPIRELVQVRLFEVSPVTFPAYPQTEIGLRGMDVDPAAVEMAKVLSARGAGEPPARPGRLAVMRRRLELADIS